MSRERRGEREGEAGPRRDASPNTYVREAHHRLQNQLQLVVALLHLEAKEQTEPKLKMVLDDLQERVSGIGGINGVLTAAASEPVMDFSALLTALCSAFNMAFGRFGAVELQLGTGACRLEGEVASHLALMVHELLMNAYKHVLRTRAGGRVRVGLDRANGEYRLVVRDDGNGFSAQAMTGTGTQLVDKLAIKIGARLERRTGATGAEVILTFKSGKSGARL
jgi:two-component sensor histidine kinase